MLAADELGRRGRARAARTRATGSPEVSRTFHARDVFAPAAAHLAAGVALDGARARRSTRRRSSGSSCPSRRSAGRRSRATVLSVDRFGNVATNVRRDAPRRARRSRTATAVEIGSPLDRYYAIVAGTFADAAPGELILYEDSYGLVTLAISSGDAARLTGAARGDEMRIALHVTLGQRFARLVTTLVVRAPDRSGGSSAAPLTPAVRPARAGVGRDARQPRAARADDAALEALPDAPGRVLDVGTGTGAAARLAAERWPGGRGDRRRRLRRDDRRGARGSEPRALRGRRRVARSRSPTRASTS